MTEPRPLTPPRVTPIGLVEYTPDYQGSARSYPWPLRLGAALLLTVFLSVVVVSTSASLGRYCLTSTSAPPPHLAVP